MSLLLRKKEKKIKESLFRTYDVFLDRVTKSRKMLKDEVEKIAGGRVWTGRQALEKGLVDELGGLKKAQDKIHKLTQLDSKTPIKEIKTI